MGVWKCCLPWCAPAEGKALTPPPPPPHELEIEAPIRFRQPSPLHDIQEEEAEIDEVVEEDWQNEEGSRPIALKSSLKKNRETVQSQSPTLSSRGGKKRQKSRSGSGSISSEVSTSTISGSGKMQAEQGTIGDLQKYHNRYLRNRRHTLANVR